MPERPEQPGHVARPMVSVIVCVRGNIEALAGLVHAVLGQDFPNELIELVVVDNHRAPRVDERFLAPLRSRYRLVHEKRAGLSRARNTGTKVARGELLVITDPDSRPAASWVRELVRAMRESGAYCAGGKVLLAPGQTPRFARLPSEVRELFLPRVWPDETTALVAPYWLVGCNIAVRNDPRPAFDERFGVRGGRHLSCEELELVERVHQAGHTVVVAPHAVVHRAVTARDIRVKALCSRAFWHGVSMARLCAVHPTFSVYDSYRLGAVFGTVFGALFASSRPVSGLVAATAVARIVGWRAERLRQRLARHAAWAAVEEASA